MDRKCIYWGRLWFSRIFGWKEKGLCGVPFVSLAPFQTIVGHEEKWQKQDIKLFVLSNFRVNLFSWGNVQMHWTFIRTAVTSSGTYSLIAMSLVTIALTLQTIFLSKRFRETVKLSPEDVDDPTSESRNLSDKSIRYGGHIYSELKWSFVDLSDLTG